jgi:vacuolar-type H+-ATPase subunit E/Vma4
LERIAAKRLNAEQTQAVENIKTFQKQAEQAREQDLLTAANLARRADLLAKDLLERLP